MCVEKRLTAPAAPAPAGKGGRWQTLTLSVAQWPIATRIVLLAAKAIAIVIYMTITELVVIPVVGIFFVKGPYWDSIGWIALVALIANVCIALSGTLFSGLALFTRARDLILPVLFLPALVPVIIAGAGATHAVVGGPHDMSEYRGYCLFLVGYAILFLLVCIATYDAVFDD